MVEQKLEKLAEYCDKILLLHEGHQIAFDTPDKIFSREDLKTYGVNPPAYTRVCQTFGIKKENGCYPASLKDALALKDAFPKEEIFAEACQKKLADPAGAEDSMDRVGTDSEKPEEIFRIEHLNFEYFGLLCSLVSALSLGCSLPSGLSKRLLKSSEARLSTVLSA